MFNISRMLSIYFGENLFYVFFSTNPTVNVLHSCLPVQSGATQCSSSAAAARPLHQPQFPKKIANLRCCSLFIFTPLPPLPPLWEIYIFEIMSVFSYQNQYKNSSMLLDAKSRFIMHCEFKCRFLPSSYIIKIFFKVNIKARGIRTDTA